MRLGLTLVSALYLLSVFLPVLALPPAGVSTPSSLAKRNDRNAISDIEARSPHLVTLKKRWFIFKLIAMAFRKLIGKIVDVVKHAKASARARRLAKQAERAHKGAGHLNKVGNNQQQQPPPPPPPGHKRRSLLEPRVKQAHPESGNKMKRSLVRQKRGLNRRMMRQLRERQSNTGFNELD